ncbi:MAG: O-antigen ligase family protein, partial [bacterium]|nr:O-antigen ligase family protein [bacterium]
MLEKLNSQLRINQNLLLYLLIWSGFFLIFSGVIFLFSSSSIFTVVLFIMLGTGLAVIFPKLIQQPLLGVAIIILVFPFSKFVYKLSFMTVEPWFLMFIIFTFAFFINRIILKESMNFTSLDFQIWLFLFIGLISLSQAIEPMRGVIRLFRYLTCFLFFFLSVNVIKTEDDFKKLFNIFVISGLIAVFGAFFELGMVFFQGQANFSRLIYITSTFRNPAEMASLMAMFIPMTLGLFIEKNYLFGRRWLHFIIIGLFVFSIGLSQTRSSIIAMSLPLLLYINKKQLWYFFISGIILLILIFSIPNLNWWGARLFMMFTPQKYSSAFVFRNKVSSAGHYYINRLMIEVWKKHPVFGVGLNNFQYHTEIPAEFSEMQIGPENVKLRQTSFYMNPKHGRASHNFYLSILVETG